MAYVVARDPLCAALALVRTPGGAADHSLRADQLKTIRYEDLLSRPEQTLAELSRFTGTTMPTAEIRDVARTSQPRGRPRRPAGPPLAKEDAAQIDKLAGEELRRLGYSLLS